MEKNNRAAVQEIREKIQQAERFLIASHIRPDGDAVGSVLGLGLALEDAGKQVEMVLADGVPGTFDHLVGADRIKKRAGLKPDLVITVDSSEASRVGSVLDGFGTADINIDHHITNPNYARTNLVDPEAVATAEILARCIPEFGLKINSTVADALLTGIITDTIGFRTSNMTPKALRVAAELMEAGANLSDLYTKGLIRRQYEAARLWGVGLSKLKRDGPLIWTSLTLADRRSIGYLGRDDADLINVIAAIEGAAIAVLFIEQSSSLVKVSWRAQPAYDVAQLALTFGGGGHPAAAGAEIRGSLDEVQDAVLKSTRLILDV
jgi:bifunctional oligoribonuclease and PAP phosphatase NrnA